MKICQILLSLIFLLFCQTAFAQTIDSSITIKIVPGNYIISGVVANDSIKNEVIERIKTMLGGNADFSKVIVQPAAELFQADWQTEFDKSLAKIKTWKSGVFVFGNNRTLPRPDYPPLPQKIANAKFELSDGRTVTLNDYPNKLIVLFFMELWASPAIKQAQGLAALYPQISSRNVEIISISSENSENEKADFRKKFNRYGFPFEYAWTSPQTFQEFVKISKLNGVPQIFLILNGKFHAVFLGGSPKVTEKLKETIIETLDENNL